MPPKASKRKATNGYRLPDPIPKGEIFVDGKSRWRIGKSIGVGGFGEIYLCSQETESDVKDTANTVMKLEPAENGPLFVEMHFYVRAATTNNMEAYKKEKGLKDVGIPCFRGKGLHTYKGNNYRFLIIDRYGKDLQKIFQTGKKTFAPKAAYNLAIRCLDALEYIHAQGYVHNDLKAQNLLLGHGRSKENDVFLVDFGLVSKYKVNGVHLEYKPDARRAHDGTIEYTSRDAHIGAHSRRSDLEILGYNLVHWMSGHLPWMNNLTNPVYVHTQKKGFMSDIPSFLRNCFGDENKYPDVLEKFLNYTVGLEFDTKPDYDLCRSLFKDELRRLRLPSDGKIDFSSSSRSSQKKKSRRRMISFNETELELHNQLKAATQGLQPTPTASPPLSMDSDSTVHSTRSTSAPSTSASSSEWCWERVLCSNPEMLIRQASRNSEAEDDTPLARQRKAVEEIKQKESLLNPTPAMLALMNKIQERELERQQLNWQQQLHHLTNGRKGGNSKKDGSNQWANLTMNPLTPAMEEVINMRAKRVSIEVDVPITPEPSDDEFDEFEDFAGVDSDSSHEEYEPPTPKRKRKSSSLKPRPMVSVQNLMAYPNQIRNKNSSKKKRRSTGGEGGARVEGGGPRIINNNNHGSKAKSPAVKNNPEVKRRALPSRSSSRLKTKLITSITSSSSSPSTVHLLLPSSSTQCALDEPLKNIEELLLPTPLLEEEGEEENEGGSLSSSSSTTSTSSLDMIPELKWEKVLRVNPERLLKKKKYGR